MVLPKGFEPILFSFWARWLLPIGLRKHLYGPIHGIRTHTLRILSPLPLPVGLLWVLWRKGEDLNLRAILSYDRLLSKELHLPILPPFHNIGVAGGTRTHNEVHPRRLRRPMPYPFSSQLQSVSIDKRTKLFLLIQADIADKCPGSIRTASRVGILPALTALGTGRQGRTRTYVVSNVPGLQPGAFATQRHLT